MVEFLSLFFGTFISEDLSCITAGILAEKELIPLTIGIPACTFGIFLSDLWLFVMGKFFFRIASKWNRVQKILKTNLTLNIKNQMNDNFAKLIILSRFTPGTRLPVYFLSGSLGMSLPKFTLYSFIASLVWTPLLVVLSYFYGKTILQIFKNPNAYLSIVFTVVSLFLLYTLVAKLLNPTSRHAMFITIQKIPRLEFWPIWIFYLPILPYITYLMLRYRGFLTITCSNPAIETGGMAGESKSKILTQLPNQWIAKFLVIEAGQNFKREYLLNYGLNFPLILKPDVGERGAFVQKVHDWEELTDILKRVHVRTILQEFHPGPYEIGVFYYRYPSQKKGKIFSITNKVFPEVIGNGKSTIQELISNHPRFRFQTETFYKNNQTQIDNIPNLGERRSIGNLGNHIQGCLFQDGSEKITEELIEIIDSISKQFNGFYFGRYDIRYANEEDLKAGKNFKIIELNGAMSESTNLYDPKFSIPQAYSFLFRQWKHLFRIGYENRIQGAKPISYWELYSVLRDHSAYKTKLLG